MAQNESPSISFFPVAGDCLDSFLEKAEAATVSNPEDRESIIRFLRSDVQYRENGIADIVKAFVENATPRPMLSILRIARKRYRCFALVEKPYFDLEDWDVYAAFYARSFTQFRRTCCRVHLFDGDEGHTSDLVEALNGGIHQDVHPLWLQDCPDLTYRGFFVLRPFRSFVVGRTVIDFDKRVARHTPGVERHELEDTGQPFCTGAIANEFHLSSLAMSLDTAPAIQQNPVVGVCATASVWVASQVLSGRFGPPQVSVQHYHPPSTKA